MPAKYRDAILENNDGQVVITVDHMDKCLLVYPMDQWVKVERTLMELPNMNRRVRNMQRLILGHAAELDLDGQGRILLPAPLREYAGLGKKAVLVGQATKFELWDAETWISARDSWLEEAQADDESNAILDQISM